MIQTLDAREREGIQRDLDSPDDEVRRLAVERVAALVREEALPALLARLGDDAWRVRKAVVERLVGAPETWDVPRALVDALADEDNPGRRNAAVEALVGCGPRAVPDLLHAAQRPDADVRKLAADALAGIGDPRATSCLVRLLRDDDPNVRAAAADALGAVAGPGAVEALLTAAVRVGEETLVRLAALRALGRLETPLRAAQLEGALDEPLLRPAAFAALGRTEDAQAQAILLKGLQSSSRSAREAAMETLLRLLGAVDAAEAERLLEALRTAARESTLLLRDACQRVVQADLGTRLVLVQFLGLLGGEAVVHPLLLAARDEALTEVAFGALAELGAESERAVAREFATLDRETRILACELLGRTRGVSGRELLLEALDAPDAELRGAAARALGRRSDRTAIPALLGRLEVAARQTGIESEEERQLLAGAVVATTNALQDVDAGVRREVVERVSARLAQAEGAVRDALARVLAGVSGAGDADLVIPLLGDASEAVRRAGVEALVRMRDGRLAEPLRLALADESPLVRSVAAGGLAGRLEAGALDDLERLLADEDVCVRIAATHAIGETLRAANDATSEPASEVGTRALGLLAGVLRDGGAVALTAAEGLQASGAAEACTAVRGLLDHADPELVQAAVRCLGVLENAAQLDEIIPLVGHGAWAVRAEVLQVLGERGVVRAVPSMLRRLEIEQDAFVREVILHTLARLEA